MLRKLNILYLLPWLTDFGLFLLIFTVSRELAESEKSLLFMGLVGAISPLAMAGGCLIGGPVSDWMGRRRIIVLGAGLLLLSPMLAEGSRYIASYAVLGFGAGLIYPPVMAWLSEGTNPGNASDSISQTLILWCLSWNFGLIAGQISGGWLFPMGRQWPLRAVYLLFAANFIVALMTSCLPSRPSAAGQPSSKRVDRHRARSAQFALLAWVANLGGAFSMGMVIYLFPKLAVDLGVPPEEHGFMLAVSRVVVIGTYLSMYVLSFWHHRFSTALASQAMAVVGLVILGTAESATALWLGLVVLSQLLGYNYFAGLYYSTTGTGDEQRGWASGMHEATLGLGFAAGAGLGGLIGQIGGLRAPYLLGAAVIVVLGAVQIGLHRKSAHPQCPEASGPAKKRP